MQADSDDSSDVVAKFSTKLSSLFTRKPFWILDSFRKTSFTSEFIFPRESRRRKWKGWRWMRRPTTHFENTVATISSRVKMKIKVTSIALIPDSTEL